MLFIIVKILLYAGIVVFPVAIFGYILNQGNIKYPVISIMDKDECIIMAVIGALLPFLLSFLCAFAASTMSCIGFLEIALLSMYIVLPVSVIIIGRLRYLYWRRNRKNIMAWGATRITFRKIDDKNIT